MNAKQLIEEALSPWTELCWKAYDKFGTHGFSTLSDSEMAELIDLERADKIAERMFGEFGIATLIEDEMEALINANPYLIKDERKTTH